MPEVRQERTHWRDEELSLRHRDWGWDCPMVDIDFLALEYDKGHATAIVEYKNEHAKLANPKHPSYKALAELGNKAGIPVIGCRYKSDFTNWRAVPLNRVALAVLPKPRELSEAEWVRFLYGIRGREMPDEIKNICSRKE
ncbi:MAG: hypothetical protein IJ587_05180 [Synergistaceae bacterium]|nr:hypothetical protein [Synergistaceae bacterium]